MQSKDSGIACYLLTKGQTCIWGLVLSPQTPSKGSHSPFRSGLPQIRLTTLLREIKVNHMVLNLGRQFPINISSIKTGCFHNKFPGSCGSGRDDMIYSLPGRRVMPFFFCIWLKFTQDGFLEPHRMYCKLQTF